MRFLVPGSLGCSGLGSGTASLSARRSRRDAFLAAAAFVVAAVFALDLLSWVSFAVAAYLEGLPWAAAAGIIVRSVPDVAAIAGFVLIGRAFQKFGQSRFAQIRSGALLLAGGYVVVLLLAIPGLFRVLPDGIAGNIWASYVAGVVSMAFYIPALILVAGAFGLKARSVADSPAAGRYKRLGWAGICLALGLAPEAGLLVVYRDLANSGAAALRVAAAAIIALAFFRHARAGRANGAITLPEFIRREGTLGVGAACVALARIIDVTTAADWRWLSYSDLGWALFSQALFRLLELIPYVLAAVLVTIAFLLSRRSAAARVTRDDDEDFVEPGESTEDDMQWETRS